MKEENVREWGMIHPLGDLAIDPDGQITAESSPTPENLIYQFTSRFTFRRPENRITHNMAMVPAAMTVEPEQMYHDGAARALSLNYGHPRFIEYPEIPDDFELSKSRSHSFVLVIFIAIAFFVVWYIYHLTGQQLRLRSENNRYLETIQYIQQVAAELVSPKIKVFSFQESARSNVTAKLFWDTNNQSCQIYLANLPETNKDQVFQLWYFTKDSQFIPVTSFNAINSAAALKLKFPTTIASTIDRIVVSVEQPGKQAFPLGKILLRGQLE